MKYSLKLKYICTLLIFALFQNTPPHVYSNAIAQCTLPRQSYQNEWPRYASNVAERNQVAPISTFHQLSISTDKSYQHLNQESLEEYAGSPSSASNSSVISTSNPYAPHGTRGRTMALQHMNQAQSSRLCIGSPQNNLITNTVEQSQSDDEATVQTPLMLKRDSSV